MIVAGFIFLAISGAVLAGLEKLLPLHPGQTILRKGWRTDLVHLVVNAPVIRFAMTMITLWFSVLSLSAAPESLREAIRAQPDWLEFIEVLILSDLFLYLSHRLTHAVPLLWRFHAVHHSSERLDWLAAYRVHPVDQLLNSAMMAAPVVLLGFSPLPVLIYSLVYRLHAPLLHSNLKIDLGWLGWFIATPRFHHWHHADQVEAYDQNFGGQLAIFDRLFGTANPASSKGLPHRYGVDGGVPAHWLGQILHPFGLWRPRPVRPVDAAEAPPAE